MPLPVVCTDPLSERTRGFKSSPRRFFKMATATELQKGSYFIYNNEPVRVLRKEVVAYGTHSHSKLKIYFQGLNDSGEKNINLQHGDKVEIVEIMKKQGQVISKLNNKLQIMDTVSYETFEAGCSPETFSRLNENDQVSFVEFRGNIQIIEKKS